MIIIVDNKVALSGIINVQKQQATILFFGIIFEYLQL